MSTTVPAWRERLARWAVTAALLLMVLELGGSLYEHLVVDPAWVSNIKVIQPDHGGLDRKVFWMPIHGALTLVLSVALWACWRRWAARRWVLVAFGLYAAMRIWTFLYFVPWALRFESAEGLSHALASDARTWVLLSTLRAPLVIAAAAALWAAAQRMTPEPA